MALQQLWEVLKESITVYTGLSPSTFFSVLSLGLAIYYMVSNLFGSSDDGPGSYQERSKEPEEKVQPLPPPVQLGEITDEELKQYDGSDKSKPLLMAIKGQIYDVSQSRLFYGPGGPYALFAGKDASRALAKMSFEKNDLNGDLTGLGAFELEALQDWEYKFVSKYIKVGTVKSSIPVSDGATNGQAAEAAETDSAKPTEDGTSVSPVPEIVETVSNVDADKKE